MQSTDNKFHIPCDPVRVGLTLTPSGSRTCFAFDPWTLSTAIESHACGVNDIIVAASSGGNTNNYFAASVTENLQPNNLGSLARLFDTIATLKDVTTKMTERGKIHSGSIILDEPIDLPEGTEVIVHVEPAVHEAIGASNGDEFEHQPFFGMWADRDEMTDSVAWVRKERDKWQQRLTQQR